MKAATAVEIRKELNERSAAQLLAITLRLARFKKENKELLTYLLFEADDEQGYVASVKDEIDQQFSTINHSTAYLIKKSIRKIVRTCNKYIRYSSVKETEAEIRIYFLQRLLKSCIKIQRSKSLEKIYTGELKKIDTVISTMHEDLQLDYAPVVNDLRF